jgi:hypothetical protein
MWAIGNKNSEHLTFKAYRINLSNKCKGDTWELWEQHKEHMTKPYGIISKETNMEKWEGGLLDYLNCK